MYSKEYVKYLKDNNLYKDTRRDFRPNRFTLYGWRDLPKLGSIHHNQIDWNKTFCDNLYETNIRMQNNMLNSSSNYITVSSEISALFDSLEYFHVSDAINN